MGVALAWGQRGPCPCGPRRCGNLRGPAAGLQDRAASGDGAARRPGLKWGFPAEPPSARRRSARILIPSASPARGSALLLTFRSCRVQNPICSGSNRRGEGDCPVLAGCRAALNPFCGPARDPPPVRCRGSREAVATTSGRIGRLSRDSEAWKGKAEAGTQISPTPRPRAIRELGPQAVGY